MRAYHQGSDAVNIYFMRVGYTKTGRPWYRLSNGKGKAFGRRFCINPEDVRPVSRRKS